MDLNAYKEGTNHFSFTLRLARLGELPVNSTDDWIKYDDNTYVYVAENNVSPDPNYVKDINEALWVPQSNAYVYFPLRFVDGVIFKDGFIMVNIGTSSEGNIIPHDAVYNSSDNEIVLDIWSVTTTIKMSTNPFTIDGSAVDSNNGDVVTGLIYFNGNQ